MFFNVLAKRRRKKCVGSINQKTAKLLSLTYPLPLLGLADEVIE
jgi:hypothetical protein